MKKHSITKLPKDIMKEGIIDSMTSIIMVIGFDCVSFFLQLGKEQISAGHIVWGLILIALFYVSSTLQKFLDLWISDIKESHREHYSSVSQERVVQLLLKCRGKVYRPNLETGIVEVMNTGILLESSKNYISNLWNLKLGLPSKILQVISLIVLLVGFLVVTNLEIENIGLFWGIILLLLFFSMIFAKNRIETRKANRKERKKEKEKQTTWLNDILNIEPVSDEHAKLMANRFIVATKNLFAVEKKQRKKFNCINVVDSLVKSIAIIAVIVIKVFEVGIENVNLEIVLSLISLITIFSQIISRINSIVRVVEEIKNNIDEIKMYEEDFERIIDVYDEEGSKSVNEINSDEFIYVEVPKFVVQYKKKDSENPFILKNEINRKYYPGDIILCNGPTGSGKSTLLKMISNKVRFENFSLNLPDGINAVMHQTDSKLSNGSVLSEIILSDTTDDLDFEKLKYILKGLKLYDVVVKRNSDIISYLNSVKYEDFSSGQKQRFVIARLLYNITESDKIVVLDEATNALNDSICNDVMMFIKEYCSSKVIFIASHQVNIVEPICSEKIIFEEGLEFFECK